MVTSGSDRTVRAAAAGIARRVPNGTHANNNHQMGNVVVIRHPNGLSTIYAHLASISVADGASVARGAAIGVYGSTGCGTCAPHLHFELKFWDRYGSLHDDLGPVWGYTTSHPNLWGYLNPYPFLEYTISDVVARPVQVTANQIVRTGPDASYTSQVTTVQAGQTFFAQAERAGWHLIHFPSQHGPATGWVQGTVTTARRAIVNDPPRGLSGVNVRSAASTSGTVRSKVWDALVLPVLEEAASGSGCTQPWYRVPLAANASGGSGWVCGQYLQVTGTVAGETPPDGPAFHVTPAWPNPTSAGSHVRLRTREPGVVRVRVVDALGRQAALLLDRALGAGTHDLVWDSQQATPGRYAIVVETQGQQEVVPVVVSR